MKDKRAVERIFQSVTEAMTERLESMERSKKAKGVRKRYTEDQLDRYRSYIQERLMVKWWARKTHLFKECRCFIGPIGWRTFDTIFESVSESLNTKIEKNTKTK